MGGGMQQGPRVRLPGLRVGPMDYPRVDAALCERARALPTTNVADCMSRLYVVRGLRPMGIAAEVKLAGPALTVRTGPADNLFVNKAIDAAHQGDVIVVDCCGGHSHAFVGEIMARYAQSRGVAGLVIDGPVRDSAELGDLRLPIFAAGVSTSGPWRNGPGEVGYPVCCGGVPVMPGDLVLGDADGIVVVPRADAEAVVAAAERVRVQESTTFGDIETGRMDRAWVDETLRRLGAID